MRKNRAEIEEKTVQNFLDAEFKKLIMLFVLFHLNTGARDPTNAELYWCCVS